MQLIRNPWQPIGAEKIAVCIVLLQICIIGAEKITSLPGQPKVNFEQYSGYIHINEPHESDRALFYYFVEAETDPVSKPLVLWLSGGFFHYPTSSSLMQLFGEHGPFHPTENVLLKNEYSWNKAANILYLEFPVGVGFSYAKNETYYATINDKVTARDNLRFLVNWLETFPQYKTRDFYIAGHSYGGHFIPQLALLVAQSKIINLKGIAIGSPQLDFEIDYNSEADYLWSHGLISDTIYDMLNTVCNVSTMRRQIVDNSLSGACEDIVDMVDEESGFLDIFEISMDECELEFESDYSSTLNQPQEHQEIDVCVGFDADAYLTRMDVQAALHARLVGVSNWSMYTPDRYSLEDLELPITPTLINLIKLGIRVLLYSGDQDSVYTFIGTRRVANNLAAELGLNVTASPYRAWFAGRQVGGWTQDYSPHLSFATIRGAGNNVGFSQPKRSLELFTPFVNGKPLPSRPILNQSLWTLNN